MINRPQRECYGNQFPSYCLERQKHNKCHFDRGYPGDFLRGCEKRNRQTYLFPSELALPRSSRPLATTACNWTCCVFQRECLCCKGGRGYVGFYNHPIGFFSRPLRHDFGSAFLGSWLFVAPSFSMQAHHHMLF